MLDGVDLDIEGGRSTGYTTFVKEIRKLMNADSSRKYIIGAAPQCPFPDGFLGPYPGKALGDVGYEFDEVYVQFYNNWCHTGNPRVFYDHMKKWLKFSMDSKPNGPMIFVGMPAKIGGSGTAANYRPLNEVQQIFNVSQSFTSQFQLLIRVSKTSNHRDEGLVFHNQSSLFTSVITSVITSVTTTVITTAILTVRVPLRSGKACVT